MFDCQLNPEVCVPKAKMSYRRFRRKGKSKYPWPDMEVGDTVLFKHDVNKKRLHNSKYAYGVKYDKFFSMCHTIRGIEVTRIR